MVMTAPMEHRAAPRHAGWNIPVPDPVVLASLAGGALRAAALLTPKPGLADARGAGTHDDMELHMFLRSATVLQPWFASLARAAADARDTPAGSLRLRRKLGLLGREAEAAMLAATGGANTHRGALYSLGLLIAGAVRAGTTSPARVARSAGELSRLPDAPVLQARSHGGLARDVAPGAGAAAHAAAGFPATLGIALPALRSARRRGTGEQAARLDALLAVMAVLDDTCVLHRGGAEGLALVRRGAADVLVAGGAGSHLGRGRLAELDRCCRERGLSPRGAAGVLATAIFLDHLDRCRPAGGWP